MYKRQLPIGEFNNPIFPADFAAFLESAPVGEVSQVYDLGQSVRDVYKRQEHLDEVDGLILLGAYLYGDYPPEDTLTIYGSLNQSVEAKIDYKENVVEIEGGNHAQFGNYGPQKGDLPATISAEEQQAQTVEAISNFIARQQE